MPKMLQSSLTPCATKTSASCGASRCAAHRRAARKRAWRKSGGSLLHLLHAWRGLPRVSVPASVFASSIASALAVACSLYLSCTLACLVSPFRAHACFLPVTNLWRLVIASASGRMSCSCYWVAACVSECAQLYARHLAQWRRERRRLAQRTTSACLAPRCWRTLIENIDR